MIEAFASQAPDIPVTIIDPEDNDTVMDRAVEACGTYAAAGDIVLMAPACASMDQFKSYADRGNRFAAAARTWSEVSWPPLIPISVRAYRAPDKPSLEIAITRVGEACSTRYGATTASAWPWWG